jgi:hypothetical protein
VLEPGYAGTRAALRWAAGTVTIRRPFACRRVVLRPPSSNDGHVRAGAAGCDVQVQVSVNGGAFRVARNETPQCITRTLGALDQPCGVIGHTHHQSQCKALTSGLRCHTPRYSVGLVTSASTGIASSETSRPRLRISLSAAASSASRSATTPSPAVRSRFTQFETVGPNASSCFTCCWHRTTIRCAIYCLV